MLTPMKWPTPAVFAHEQFPVVIKRLEAVLKTLPDERLNPASTPTPHPCCTMQ